MPQEQPLSSTYWLGFGKIILAILPVFLGANIGWSAWLARQIMTHESKLAACEADRATYAAVTQTVNGHDAAIARIEATRFTSSEGLAVWQAIAAVRESIALAKDTPPKWLIDRLDRMERRQDELISLTQANGAAIATLTARMTAHEQRDNPRQP